MTLNEVLERLEKFDFSDEFYMSELDQIVEDLESVERPSEAIESVFRFIENHPDEDLGLPGPLVHFVEQFGGKGYGEKLATSLRRRATAKSVWMLNRLLNDPDLKEKPYYVSLMEELSRSKDQEVAAAAHFYLDQPSWA